MDQTVDLKSGNIIFEGIQSSFRESHWMEESNHVIILDREFDKVAEISMSFVKKIL